MPYELEKMYPDIAPYDSGLLDVGDGNSMYWECCGNPDGLPAVYVHGGPGSACAPGARRFFDPEKYKIVLFDQRGCGRSRPLLNDRSHLQFNTTQHLIRDMELLRGYLRIQRWVMLGVSWGSTLSLAYAQAFTERVAALVLGCVTTTSRREVEWITHGVGRIFPRRSRMGASLTPTRRWYSMTIRRSAGRLLRNGALGKTATSRPHPVTRPIRALNIRIFDYALRDS